ncbi:STAS/SEC14 domain-containing protein [Gramella sp. GC03-9]|uniref:STAS/SEC14 domain-containing protein n=1 Tax=Christiangramia oceanisediminis TaxID=2920386 RepID=A0A9X2I2R9_9FLAO|nr:STAS/SEC14 domain-containing protein [Gramella oceanisediminis]MCP9199610.1 STAS/SEC14 domain-containing protein [Gramella oceanisediminis]
MLASFELAGHVIGLIINRDLTGETVDEIIAECDKKIRNFDSLNIFIELERGHEVTLKGLLKGINYKYSNSDYFDKIAIVTDSRSFQIAVDLSDTFLDVETRTYELKDRLEALQWISL